MGKEFKVEAIFMGVVMTAVFFLSGCTFMPHSYTSGKPIKESKVEMIQPGKTTKDEIIQWFGIPASIQKEGEKTTLPKQEPTMIGVFAGPSVVSESSFELFSSKHKIMEDHRIYAYYYTKASGTSFGLLFFNSMSSHSVSDKLLVLINEKTGIAEDYIFRKQE